ncbi:MULTISPECIES: family 16 glycosylhydrolase [unclassified Lacinutrix]
MKKLCYYIVLLVFMTTSCKSKQIPETKSYQPTSASQTANNWKLVNNLSDEFNTTEINWDKWFKTKSLPNTTGWKWDNTKNIKLNNGVAELIMQHNENNVSDGGTYFKSGILKSKETFTTGYVEARIKGAIIDVLGPINGYGVCPSLWLYSDFDRTVEEGKTVYCEIDIVELQQFDWHKGHQDDIRDSDHNLHLVKKQNGKDVWFRPKKHPETQLNKYRLKDDPSKNYHIYGCEVNEKEIIWYVDGVKIASKPNTDWYRPMNVTASLGLRRPFVKFSNNANRAVDPLEDEEAKKQLQGMPTTMYVDYIRVWTKKK